MGVTKGLTSNHQQQDQWRAYAQKLFDEMPQQTFFARNIVFSSCTHNGMVMQELAFECDAEGLPLCSHLQAQPARAYIAWQSDITKNLLHYAKQLQVSNTYFSCFEFSIFNCALHLHIHVLCNFDKHMCQLLRSILVELY
jgi:hypothetical protein